MNEWQRKLKQALHEIEKKRFNAFNSQIAPGLELEVKENICSRYIRAWLMDVSKTPSRSLFMSYLYIHKEDVLIWIPNRIKQLFEESQFMENLGYTQTGYAQFRRNLDDTRSIQVERNITSGFSSVEVTLNKSIQDEIFGETTRPLDRVNKSDDMKSLVLEMERKYMKSSSFHLMNNNLRDLLILS